MTVGALQTLGEQGVRMPADLSLIGYDDMEWWTLTRPPLTTVGQPVYDLGREAMRLLLAQIGAFYLYPKTEVVPLPQPLKRLAIGCQLGGGSALRDRAGSCQPDKGNPPACAG